MANSFLYLAPTTVLKALKLYKTRKTIENVDGRGRDWKAVVDKDGG